MLCGDCDGRGLGLTTLHVCIRILQSDRTSGIYIYTHTEIYFKELPYTLVRLASSKSIWQAGRLESSRWLLMLPS